ncbi:MAG: nitroreductase [Limimaricola sp.]|uniref:nitroreductase family protein n=1 Tax=Limimaricola sp. TaxID=2211665 RepID=UPI001D30AC14|nr:nitroreductase family protein [Limimaricola sp.]MBI1415847.1 nitroreductase [Limimaricola sp.]
MPARNQPALDFLLTRRSRPAKTLVRPAPDRDQLTEILTAAARTPDHGKLEPWRFVVLGRAALDRLAQSVAARAATLSLDAAATEKAVSQYRDSPLAVVVIASPKAQDKVPQIEQTWSAGAACLALLNAALAAGWGANWLTGWAAHDRALMGPALALSDWESVVGFVHIGTETAAPPERPRPDLARIVDWQLD